MGKLVKGSKWAKETFEVGSRPTDATMIRLIESEEIPGKIIDGKPYVDADRFALGEIRRDRPTGLDLIA